MSTSEYNILITVSSYDQLVGPVFSFMLDDAHFKIALKINDGSYIVTDSKNKVVTLIDACKGVPLVFYYVLSEIFGMSYDAMCELEQQLVDEAGYDFDVIEENTSLRQLDDQLATDKKQIN